MKRRALYLALVHYPIVDKSGSTIATAVTNFDVHDIARVARTYDCAGYFLVTPVRAQQEVIEGIRKHWLGGAGQARVPTRSDAIALVAVAESIDAAVQVIAKAHETSTVIPAPPSVIPAPPSVIPAPPSVLPAPPSVLPAPPSVIPAKAGIQQGPCPVEIWATAARSGFATMPYSDAQSAIFGEGPPILLLFGTGHGLADEVLSNVHRVLAPIRAGGYNHLSVRTAVAITLDRLLGETRPDPSIAHPALTL